MIALILLAGVALGSEDRLLDEWLTRQAAVQTWTAEVVQTRHLASLTRPLRAEGRVWFASPDRFRWQLGDPPHTIAIRKREALLVIYPKLARAERFPLDGEIDEGWRQALSLLEIGFPRDAGEFRERYELVGAVEEDGRLALALRPRSARARRLVREVRFEIDGRDRLLRATELVFPDGSRMRNDFHAPALEVEVPDERFEEDLTGYEIVEPLASTR